MCEQYSGIDRTLWRLDSSTDPAVSSAVEKIDLIVHTLNDLEKVQSQVEQNNEVITSLRVSKTALKYLDSGIIRVSMVELNNMKPICEEVPCNWYVP